MLSGFLELMQQVQNIIKTSREAVSGPPAASLGVAVALTLILTWLATGSSLMAIIGAFSAAGTALVWIYPKQALVLLVGSLFLESETFSIALPWGRVRVFHMLALVLAIRALYDLIAGRIRLRRTLLDIPLLAFIGVGITALPLAPDFAYAVKILGLTVFLALLYWLIVHYVRTADAVRRITKWFVAFGLLQILIGIGQVTLAYIDARYGPLGFDITVFHSEILPFGRPFGTFVEPDWFGAIAGALLALIAVRVFDRKEQNQMRWLGLTLLVGGALVLSGVRGAWLGAVGSAIFVVLFNRSRQWLNLKAVPAILISAAIILAFLALVLPELTSSLIQRLVSLGSLSAVSDEPRLAIVQEGIEIWLRSPWLGHGPGGFGSLGTVPSIPAIDALVQGLVPFQTNIIVNVLIDAGVIGLLVAGWMTATLIRMIRRGFMLVPQELQTTLLGLTAALVGLAVTYQVTTGAWLALTWFLVGLTASTALIRKSTQV